MRILFYFLSAFLGVPGRFDRRLKPAKDIPPHFFFSIAHQNIKEEGAKTGKTAGQKKVNKLMLLLLCLDGMSAAIRQFH